MSRFEERLADETPIVADNLVGRTIEEEAAAGKAA